MLANKSLKALTKHACQHLRSNKVLRLDFWLTHHLVFPPMNIHWIINFQERTDIFINQHNY